MALTGAVNGSEFIYRNISINHLKEHSYYWIKQKAERGLDSRVSFVENKTNCYPFFVTKYILFHYIETTRFDFGLIL